MAFVQRVADNEDFGDATQVLTITPTAGALLALGISWVGTGVVSSVADDQGNTWNIGVSQITGLANNKMIGYYAMNVAGAATTITITYSAAPGRQRATVHEYSGRATTGALDAGTGQGQEDPGTGTDAVTSGNITTATTCDVMGFSSAPGFAAIYTAGTNYTLGGTANATADEYRDAVAAGTFAATFTFDSAFGDPDTLVMAFKAAAGGGGPASEDDAFEDDSVPPWILRQRGALGAALLAANPVTGRRGMLGAAGAALADALGLGRRRVRG